VRPGGVILVDNTLWSGRVVDPRSESDRFITGFNDVARNDPRVELVILPIADGLTMARRLP
jgi:caffeoyl-CoA O-methyltransferase